MKDGLCRQWSLGFRAGQEVVYRGRTASVGVAEIRCVPLGKVPIVFDNDGEEYELSVPADDLDRSVVSLDQYFSDIDQDY
jgi:hypothetical protein